MENISAHKLLEMIEQFEKGPSNLKEPFVTKKCLIPYLKSYFGLGYTDFSALPYYKDELAKKVNSGSIQKDYPVFKNKVITIDDVIAAYHDWLSITPIDASFEDAWNEFSTKSTPTFFSLIWLEDQAIRIRAKNRKRDEEQEFLEKYDLCFPRNHNRNVIKIAKRFFDTFNQYYSFLGFDPEQITSLEKVKIGRDWSYQNEKEKANNFVESYTEEDVLKVFALWNPAMQINEEFKKAWQYMMSNPIEHETCPSYAQLSSLQKQAELYFQRKREGMHLGDSEQEFLKNFQICFSNDFSKNNIVCVSHFFDVFNLYSASNGLDLHQMGSLEKIEVVCKWAKDAKKNGPIRERKNETCI